MNPSHPATEHDPLAGYEEDGYGEPETTTTEPDDDPAGPDDFTPPIGGRSAEKARSNRRETRASA